MTTQRDELEALVPCENCGRPCAFLVCSMECSDERAAFLRGVYRAAEDNQSNVDHDPRGVCFGCGASAAEGEDTCGSAACAEELEAMLSGNCACDDGRPWDCNEHGDT